MNRILKLKEIVELTKLSKTTVYRLVKEGKFPRPIKTSDRASGFFQHELEQWMQECANKRYESKEIQGGDSNA